MGQVKKIGREYTIEFYARGLLYQQKAGHDPRSARKLLQDIEEKIAKGEMNTLVREAELDIFFKTFLEFAKKNHTRKTYGRFKEALGHFAKFLGKKLPPLTKLPSITPKVMEDYKEDLIKTNGSQAKGIINLRLFLLGQVWEYARKLGYLNDNPMLHVRWLKEEKKRRGNTLTEEEVRQVFNCCNEEEQIVIAFIVYAGLRPKELFSLQWSHIDFQKRAVNIHCRASEEYRPRTIPLDTRLYELLKRFKEGLLGRAPHQNIIEKGYNLKKNFFTKIKESANLKQVLDEAVLRDTFVKNLLQKGVNLANIYNVLGFKDIALVMRYSCFMD